MPKLSYFEEPGVAKIGEFGILSLIMAFLSTILPYVQIILSVLLVITVLLQQNEAGLGAAFGGSGGDTITRTRRGFEKTLFNATIIIAILFVASAIIALFV